MGPCREEEKAEEEADTAAASWPRFAWWADLGRERKAIPWQSFLE